MRNIELMKRGTDHPSDRRAIRLRLNCSPRAAARRTCPPPLPLPPSSNASWLASVPEFSYSLYAVLVGTCVSSKCFIYLFPVRFSRHLCPRLCLGTPPHRPQTNRAAAEGRRSPASIVRAGTRPLLCGPCRPLELHAARCTHRPFYCRTVVQPAPIIPRAHDTLTSLTARFLSEEPHIQCPKETQGVSATMYSTSHEALFYLVGGSSSSYRVPYDHHQVV